MFVPKNKMEFCQLVKEHKCFVGLELGVWKGEYSEALLANTDLETLYLCDSWCEREDLHRTNKIYGTNEEHSKNYETTIKRVKPYFGRFITLKMDSLQASNLFDTGELDFIYIDGNHEYDAVLDDCYAWYPKVKKGGIFSGHDFVDLEHEVGSFGVKRAVTQFMKELNRTDLQATVEDPNAPVDQFFPTWWIIK